ncbi:MAG TPA: hypothetical protein VGJ86_25525 [Acidimicrobiales bacterium]
MSGLNRVSKEIALPLQVGSLNIEADNWTDWLAILAMWRSISMGVPTLQDVTNQLQAVSGVEQIDPDVPILTIDDLDSLDLMEWLYSFQEEYPEIPADESLFEEIDETVTLRSIYERVIATVPS